MIQANEKLLPGNVVMYHGHKDVPQILDALKIYNISYSDSYYPLVYSPIPLTPEVLVGWCGFEKMIELTNLENGELINISAGKFDVYANFNRKSLMVVDEIEGAISIPLPEHLHQFQNLIYFLSGEELVVTIPQQ